MKGFCQLFFLSAISSIIMPFNMAIAEHKLDIETAMIFTGYNDVAISDNIKADKFSFKEDLNSEPIFGTRIRYEFVNDKHWFGALVAPLSVRPTGTFDRDIVFRDRLYAKDSDLDALYKFNSYRVSYRYLLHDSPQHQLRVGGALKIRDAEISLDDTVSDSSKKNLGVVPLLSLNYTYKATDKMNLVVDGEALGAKQGRAADIFLGTTYNVHDKVALKAGYRVLEGGADNNEVYNFALFHYASVGAVIEF